MRVISYTATLPKKEKYTEESLKNATDKLDTLRYFVQGVNAEGDQGIIETNMTYQPSEVAVILGWVHEHGKTAAHLQFRQEILEGQRASGGRTVIADSNLFLYRNKENPGYWLRYSYDGIFANTGEYCDQRPNPDRWKMIQEHYKLKLQPGDGREIISCYACNVMADGAWPGGMLWIGP